MNPPATTTNPRLRRLYDSARRLAALRARRDAWRNVAKALANKTPGKKGEE